MGQTGHSEKFSNLHNPGNNLLEPKYAKEGTLLAGTHEVIYNRLIPFLQAQDPAWYQRNSTSGGNSASQILSSAPLPSQSHRKKPKKSALSQLFRDAWGIPPLTNL